MIGSIFQATAFLPANFLLPQLFQGVSGADALHSGLMLLPFAVSVSLCTIVGTPLPSLLHTISHYMHQH